MDFAVPWLKPESIINIDFSTSKDTKKNTNLNYFNIKQVFSDHHTQVHTRTRQHSVTGDQEKGNTQI